MNTKLPAERVRTGYMWDERLMWHDTGRAGGLLESGGWIEPYEHNEHPDAKRRIHNLFTACELTDRLTPVPSRVATKAELGLIHSDTYLDSIERGSKGRGGEAGPFTVFGRGSFEIAARAVGGLLNAVDMVLDGELENAYALLRPPGHHAGRDVGLGGCIFANVAIAAAYATQVRGLKHVAVVDFDAHHGNGTQEAFYSDPSVLTISVHQRNWYTLKGNVDETGEGPGAGFAINVPLPSGSGKGAYLAAFDQVILPALRRCQPELILCAAGFDAGAFDPTSSMILGSDAFREIVDRLIHVSRDVCDGRFVMSHEGGYSPWATPFSVLSAIEALSGVKTEIEDPYLTFIKDSPDQELLPHQAEAIAQAVQAAGLEI